MDAGIIITAGVTVVVAFGGYFAARWRDRVAKLHERKQDLYKDLVLSFKGFSADEPDAPLKQQFVDETRLARLYASDEAIVALNKLLDHLKKDEKSSGQDYQGVAHNLWGKFVTAMRKDLGIKTKLSAEELGRTERINKR